MFPKIGGAPKSSILTGFSIINHPFWGTPNFGNTQFLLKILKEPFSASWFSQSRCFFSGKSSGAALQKRHHPRGPYVICIPFDGSFDSSPKKTSDVSNPAFLGLHFSCCPGKASWRNNNFFTKQNSKKHYQKNNNNNFKFLVLVSTCIGWTFSIRTDVVEVGSDSPSGASWHQRNKSPCAESGKLCGVYPTGFTSEFLYNKRTFLVLVFHFFLMFYLRKTIHVDTVKIGLKSPPREAS